MSINISNNINSTFECNKCGKLFKYQYLLRRHISSKIRCDTTDYINKIYNDNIKEIDDKINELYTLSINSKNNCFYCNNKYSTKSSLLRHMNSCKIKLNLINKKNSYIVKRDEKLDALNNININTPVDEKFNELQQQLNKIEKILESKTNIDISGITLNNNNTNNIFINNVNLNSFGHEDLSHITDKDYQKYLSKLFSGFLEFVHDVHFSDNMPNNHNICMPKIDSKYIAIYEKNKWVLKEKDTLLPKIISNKITMLDKKCDKLEEEGKINDKYIDLYNDFATNYYTDDETKKKYCDELALMIFNNRNKIENYDKMLE
jgi:hypothetical protein